MRFSVLVPASIAGFRTGSAASSCAVAGARCCPSVATFARNGCCTRSDSVPTASVEGDSAIADCQRVRVAGDRLERRRHVREQLRGGLRDRRQRPGEPVQRVDQRGQAGARIRQCSRDRLEVAEQRRQARERVVQGRAAAGQRVSEPDQVLLDRAAGLGVERLEDVVELHRHAASGRWAALPPSAITCWRRALVQVDVLEAEHRRAGGSRRVEFDRDARRGPASAAVSAARRSGRWPAEPAPCPRRGRSGSRPSRTSLPTVRSAPLAMSTLSSRVGTNGRPRLALYARNTAISSTSTVTAPIRTGLREG